MFFSEFIASALLMFLIYALKDEGNIGAGPLTPLGLFFIIFGIGACFGWETGYAINLARDFGPRLVSYMIGYGSEVWSAGGYYFWIPMVSPVSLFSVECSDHTNVSSSLAVHLELGSTICSCSQENHQSILQLWD